MNKFINFIGILVLFLFAIIFILALSPNKQREDVGLASNNNAGISRYIDNEAGVVCWLYNTNRSDSISCVPLSQTRLK